MKDPLKKKHETINNIIKTKSKKTQNLNAIYGPKILETQVKGMK